MYMYIHVGPLTTNTGIFSIKSPVCKYIWLNMEHVAVCLAYYYFDCECDYYSAECLFKQQVLVES